MLHLIPEIVSVYREIDTETDRFRQIFGLSCPDLCGSCCESRQVEATVLEVLPLAGEMFVRKETDVWIPILQAKAREEATPCVLYRPEAGNTGRGRCGFYGFRPLVCRLFGFASRRNKKGVLEPCLCGRVKDRWPAESGRSGALFSGEAQLPPYQDRFMRIAAMHPIYGVKRLPINTALLEALGYLELKMHGVFMEKAA